VTKEPGATVLSGRSGGGRHGGAPYSGLKSKPPSGPGVTLSGVTKEPGCCQKESILWLYWLGKEEMDALGKEEETDSPSGPSNNLSGVTKELGATVGARSKMIVHKKRAEATFEDEEDDEYDN
jgi:hypothetical protein